MNIKTFIPYFLLLIFNSCQKDVYLEINSDNVIVVNSILSPDSLVQVHISKSQDLSDSSETINLNSADVSIYADSTFIENMIFTGNGIYESSFTPIVGVNYAIKVNSESLTSVTSTTTIPVKIEIDTVIAENKSFEGFNFCLQITITDDGSINNCYRLKLKGHVIEYDYSTIDQETGDYVIINEIFSDVLFFINDPIISSSSNSSSKEIINSIVGTYETGLNVVNWVAFSDQNINGTTHTIELYVVDNINPSNKNPLYIEFETIHQDYYYYLHSITNTNRDDIMFSIIPVYNNIQNGAGIFSASNIDIDSIIEFN